MDNIIKNYEEVLEKPPSTRLFLKFLKHKINVKKQYKKNIKKQQEHVHEPANNPPEGLDIYSFAIVLDDVVVDVMNVQKEFGEILKQNPKFVFIAEGEHRPHHGWVYKDGSFVSIHDILEQTHVTLRG
jgi:hypothetical protein